MNGTDHQMPQPWLGRVVAEANADAGRLPLRGHVARRVPARASRRDGLVTVRGELRSGARANLLMGVGSNRVDVHRACAAAERVARAARRAAERAVPARRSVPARARRRRVAQPRVQQRARLVVRVQRRRGGRPGARPLLRGAPDRRRPHARRGARARRAGRRAGRRDGRREPDRACAYRARRGHAAGQRSGARASTPHGAARPAQVVGELSGEAYATMVTGQKVRWVLDLIRGTEFAGRDITSYELDERGRRRRLRARPAGGRTRRHAPRPLRAARAAARARHRGHTVSLRLLAAPLRRVLFDTGEIDGLRLVVLHLRRRRRCRRGPGHRQPRHDARQRAPARRRRRDHRHLHDRRRRTASRRRAWAGSSTAATAATPTTTRRPPTIASIDAPDAVRVTTLEPGPVRARVRIDADYTWPTHADRRLPIVPRPQRRDASLVDGHDDARAARAASASCASRTSSTTAPATTGSAPTSRCPARVDGSDAECAFTVVHRGLTAEGGAHEFGLPTFLSRRFVDASDGDGRARARARRAARVRGRRRRPRARAHAAARGRLPLALRAVAAPEPGRPDRARRRRAAARPPARRLRGAPARAATGAPATATPRPTRSSSRSSGRERPARAAPARPPAGARCASTAPRSRRCCDRPAAWSCACSAPTPTPGRCTIEHDGAPAARLDHRPPGPPGRAVRRHRRAPPVGDLHAPTRLIRRRSGGPA